MTPPRHGQKTPTSLTDSQKMEAIAERAAEAAAERVADELSGAADAQSEDSSDRLRAEILSHALHCEGLRKLEERVKDVEKTQMEQGKMLQEMIGAMKLTKWVVPMAASICTSALAVAIFKMLWAHK